jgi:FkbM family methyltransferase
MLNSIRRALRRFPRAFDAAKAIGRALGNQTDLSRRLNQLLPARERFSFIQVGAADGLLHDPYREFILRSGTQGVFVEPLPRPFQQLKQNYAHKRGFHFANCAVGYPPGELKLFTLNDRDVAGESLLQMTSASEQVLRRSVTASEGAELAEVAQITVPCLTVEQIMEQYKIAGFDCVFMDIEGHEGNVLLNMDFSLVRPTLIAYEHMHLGDSREQLTRFLSVRGFRIEECHQDTIAYKPN